jgi:hypothetical protein
VQVGEGDDEPPETTSSSPPAPLELEVEEENDVVEEEDGAAKETDAVEDKAPVLEKAPVVDPLAAVETEAAPAVVPERQDSERAAPKVLTDDEIEAERMMAETNALVFECGCIPFLFSSVQASSSRELTAAPCLPLVMMPADRYVRIW